jgi:hypothetical protein
MQIPLYQAPPYVALSYCWGTLIEKAPIALNRQAVGVTLNLHAALLRLRRKKVEYIWVDALCINQEDKEERSIQIGRMAAIYKQAKEVVIWLGEMDDTSEVDLAMLSEVNFNTAATEVFDICSATVFQLLSRDYWSRMWIVQELAAASRITLLCGSFAIPWQTIRRFLDLDHEINDSSRPIPGKTRFEKISSFRDDKLARKPITLIEALYRTRHALATDPKDKLYALLGLSYDSTNFIPHPNYNLTKEEVYKRFTIALLENGYPLSFILLKSAQRKVHASLPSWAVDWSDLNDRLAKILFSTSMNDDKPLQEVTGQPGWTVNGDVLKIEGLLLGHVRTLKTSYQSVVDSAHDSGVDRSARSPISSFLSIRMVPTISITFSCLYQGLKVEDTLLEALKRMIDGKTDYTTFQHTEKKMAQRLGVQLWLNRGELRIYSLGNGRDDYVFKNADDFFNIFLDLVQLGMHLVFHDEAGAQSAVQSDGAAVSSVGSECAVNPMHVFLPSRTKTGDIVVAIRGWAGPVILREESGRYRLVGAGLLIGSGIKPKFEDLKGWQPFDII